MPYADQSSPAAVESRARRFKKWYEKNRESCLALNKTEEKREYKRLKAKEYRAKDPARAYANKKRARQANPERVNEYNARRNANLRAAVGSFTKDEWLAICQKQNDRCAECGLKCRLTIDHIVPIKLGGTSFAYNIQGLCRSCNSSKQHHLRDYAKFSLFDRAS